MAQAAAGKAEAGIAVAEVEDQARLAVADLTMTRWTLTSRVLLAGTHSATNLCHIAAGFGYLEGRTICSQEAAMPMYAQQYELLMAEVCVCLHMQLLSTPGTRQ